LEVLVIKKFLTLLVALSLLTSILVVPAKAGADLDRTKTTEVTTSFKPTIGSSIQPKGNLNEKGISKNSTITTKPELKEEKTYYSDTIQVLVTERIRNRIDEKLLDFEEEIKMLAQVVYNEARGIKGTHHKAGPIWCVLNRVDDERFSETISEVITYPNAFAWYANTKVEQEFVDLATDVVTRWLLEKEGCTEVGRVLPQDYLFFHGTDGVNKFKKTVNAKVYWDWTLGSPYTD
jgi:hypothetical protein